MINLRDITGIMGTNVRQPCPHMLEYDRESLIPIRNYIKTRHCGTLEIFTENSKWEDAVDIVLHCCLEVCDVTDEKSWPAKGHIEGMFQMLATLHNFSEFERCGP